MKKYVFRLKENPQNSSHHSSCFIWCGKAVQLKREWKGGELKPSCDCFNNPNVSLMKNLLFSMMIFWRERGTGKPFFTVDCFAREVLPAWLSPSPGAPLLSAPPQGQLRISPADFLHLLIFKSIDVDPLISWLCWLVLRQPKWHWGAKCQHKWFSKWLMKLRHCPLRCSCLSPGTHFEKWEGWRNMN